MPRRGQPKPKQVAPRPESQELKNIYSGIVSHESTSRLNALTEAFTWYDKAITHLADLGKLNAKVAKTLDIAVKCRRQGISSVHDAEKESAFKFALQKYETVCEQLHPPPVKAFFEKYETVKTSLEEKAAKLAVKYNRVVQAISSSLHPLSPEGVSIDIVVAPVDDNRRFHPELNKLVYNKPTADRLAEIYYQGGVLPLAFSEIIPLSRGAALERDYAKGNYTLNPIKQIGAIERMLKSLLEYLRTYGVTSKTAMAQASTLADPNVVNAIPSSVPKAQVVGTPRAPRQPSAGAPRSYSKSSTKVGGQFVAGSHIAKLYEFLSDQQPHYLYDLKDFADKEGFGNAMKGRLGAIRVIGQRSGLWELQGKNPVTLIIK